MAVRKARLLQLEEKSVHKGSHGMGLGANCRRGVCGAQGQSDGLSCPVDCLAQTCRVILCFMCLRGPLPVTHYERMHDVQSLTLA